MPRASLPHKMKFFRSFEVLLTQTTAEDIWAFLIDAMKEFNAKNQFYINKLERFVQKQYDQNPYEDENFDTVVDYINEFGWQDDFYLRFIAKASKLRFDLELCMDVLFDDDEDKRDQVQDWLKELAVYFGKIEARMDEFKLADRANYRKSMTEYRAKHSRRIKTRAEGVSHQFCGFPEVYKEPHIEGIHYYMKGNTRQYFGKDCKTCVEQRKWYEEGEVMAEKEKAENEAKKKEYEENREKIQAEEKRKEQERYDALPTHTCETCGYSTKSKYCYDEHMNSKEHDVKTKVKRWYCDACQTQCRTEVEWLAHVASKKHRIATGEITKQELYHCDLCDYTTSLRSHWTQHNASKKHKEAVAKQNEAKKTELAAE